jgi:DNA-directed RNA polymerase alpha subunit
MSKFFISCKESRIEHNKSFYGCFYLGPFEPTQSITIANSLRRTLLSDLYGLAIISVEIEGASHEYSNLIGVRDSVLDILLNLKEIVLKKTVKEFKPQIGYLRVRGPAIVRAADLRLPPFIQSVDPNQYIATLADNGFLNMKIIIQYGNKWLSSSNLFSGSLLQKENTRIDLQMEPNFLRNQRRHQKPKNLVNFNFQKRLFIFKKLNQIGLISAKDSITNLSKNGTLLIKKAKNLQKKSLLKLNSLTIFKKYPGLNLKKIQSFQKSAKLLKPKRSNLEKDTLAEGTSVNISSLPFLEGVCVSSNKNGKKTKKINLSKLLFLRKNHEKYSFSNSNPLNIDAVFNPINKVNYIIEVNDSKTTLDILDKSLETSELYEMLKNTSVLAEQAFEEGLRTSEASLLRSDGKSPITRLSSEKNTSSNSFIINQTNKQELENILEIKRELNFASSRDLQKKNTIKHNITLEIWTNGSLHPRDALYQAFKNLIKLFSNLKKINPFLNEPNMLQKGLNFNKLSSGSSSSYYANGNNLEEKNNYLLKQIKTNQISSFFYQDLIPLNETSFLETYITPNLRNFYINNTLKPNILFLRAADKHTPLLRSDGVLPFGVRAENFQNPILTKNLEQHFLLDKLPPQPLVPSPNFALFKDTPKTKEQDLPKIGDFDISLLNLSLRTYTYLKRLKISTIGELIKISEGDLNKLDKKSIEQIFKNLNKIGLNLEM